MTTDFNFNMPLRAQSFSRNPHVYRPVPRVTERASHSCHVFCRECFSRIFLGTTAFKIYLLIAWCIGLAALMILQKQSKDKEGKEKDRRFNGRVGVEKEVSEEMLMIAMTLIYLLSQIFGLLAAVSEIEKFFIPYVVILLMVTITNVVFLSIAVYGVFAINFLPKETHPKDFMIDHTFMLIGSLVFLIYNLQCFCAVFHLCAHFDKKRFLTAQRRREIMAHNARVYARLIAMQNEPPSAVSMNVDSPPKYSAIETKHFSDTPPPVYGQVTISKEEEEKKECTTRRALFQDSLV